MMRLQWFAVALMIFGALAVGQTAGALEFTAPINAPYPGSIHDWPTDPNGDGTLNVWCTTDGDVNTFCLWADDDLITTGNQCHVIYDLGRMTDITQIRLTARNDPYMPRHNPKNTDFYYFVDGNPYDSDDIEGDANIQSVGNYDIPAIWSANSHDVDVTDFSARYVGMRVNTSWETDANANTQISEILFETPDTTPMRSPLIAYHSSATDPGYCVDADFSTHAVFSDDDAGTMGVQGHIVFDLGEATEVGGMKMKSWKSSGWSDFVNPKDVDFYYFVDDDPSNNAVVDDIEGDDDIVLINSHEFTALKSFHGWPEFTYFDNEVEKRYIGMRVNSSHDAANLDFKMAEIELFAGGGFVPPPPIPGDANRDDVVDDKDASILAAHWLETREGTVVPEPTTVAMLLGGLLSLWIWRRR